MAQKASLSVTLIFAGLLLGACETTSAALDGVGGVFVGAGEDVRRLSR